MPGLKKLTLANFGFDDVNTLTSCLSTQLQYLNLSYVKMGTMLEWSTSEVDDLVTRLSQLKRLVSLNLAGSASIADRHLRVLLPNLKCIRCLDVSEEFGNNGTGGHSQLSDVGLKLIADNCPKILGLGLNYQQVVTIAGVRDLLQKCSDMVALEIGGMNVGTEYVEELVATPRQLLFFLFGAIGFRPNASEQLAIQKAIKGTEGRAVVCTVSGGRVDVNLPLKYKERQEESVANINKANGQEIKPVMCNKWDGIL